MSADLERRSTVADIPLTPYDTSEHRVKATLDEGALATLRALIEQNMETIKEVTGTQRDEQRRHYETARPQDIRLRCLDLSVAIVARLMGMPKEVDDTLQIVFFTADEMERYVLTGEWDGKEEAQ